METQIFTKENLDIAAKALQQGEIVSFPTETVYGLGAIATSQEAVLKVFEAKGRPSDNPLIVHISVIQQMTSTVEEVPEIALTLAKAFWPGPLTMILKAKPGIYAPALSAGLPTVSFRMPNHPVTLELITKVGIPLVGPSANLSTKPSPTKVEHVFEDMNGRIRGIVDGGSSTVGVESTVIDLTNEEGPVILRPGVITKDQIESVIGPIQSSITTTIPLWKNQIAIAMTLLRQKDAVTAQRQVSETTNQLIQKNSEMLKISTIETARENERGIIDLETLQKTQQDLIETLEETILIQQEGRQKRRKAEYELTQMEQELRENLLVLSQKEKRVKEEMRG